MYIYKIKSIDVGLEFMYDITLFMEVYENPDVDISYSEHYVKSEFYYALRLVEQYGYDHGLARRYPKIFVLPDVENRRFRLGFVFQVDKDTDTYIVSPFNLFWLRYYLVGVYFKNLEEIRNISQIERHQNDDL